MNPHSDAVTIFLHFSFALFCFVWNRALRCICQNVGVNFQPTLDHFRYIFALGMRPVNSIKLALASHRYRVTRYGYRLFDGA